MLLRAARSRTSISASSIVIDMSHSDSSSSIFPASTFERSRMSLMSERRCCPEAWMSFRYSSCFSFSSPNMRSMRTSENPMTALSGVRSSCDMLARNSDLCWLATASSRLFCSISPEEPRVLDREGRLRGEGGEKIHDRRGKFSRRLGIDCQRSDQLILEQQGHRQNRTIPGSYDDLESTPISGLLEDVRDLDRRSGIREPSDRPFTPLQRSRPQHRDDVLLEVVGSSKMKRVRCRVILPDGARVRLG